ncbi:MAG: hypothetical protein SOZ23_01535 [Methanosphaera sp.]|nr:hypothetical protein [Methanosphaera sp.]MDD6535027.1 hypothetical protein [Methanosphaera sp.]MDY3955460.1 hypothetical protein [Methanosphaera sp.]
MISTIILLLLCIITWIVIFIFFNDSYLKLYTKRDNDDDEK